MAATRPGRASPSRRARLCSLLWLCAVLAVPAAGVAGPVDPRRDEGLYAPPVSLPAPLVAATRALEAGDAAKARELARGFVKESPRSALGHEFLGGLAIARKDWAEAEAEMGEALRIEPRRGSAIMGLGRVALGKGEAARAEGLFRKALEVDPGLLVARSDLAVALLRQRQVARAVAELQQSLRVSQGADGDARYLLGGIAYEVGDLDDAERALAPLVARGEAGPLTVLALVRIELGQGAAARPLLDRVVARDATSPWGRLAGAVRDREAGQVAAARAALEKVARDQPQWFVAHRQLGLTLLREGQREAALKALERAEAVSSDPDLARVRTAQALLLAGDAEGALARARSVLASPTAAGVARTVVVAAHRRLGKPAEAERDLEAAVKARPRETGPLVDLGRFYLGAQRPRDALARFQAAAAIDPGALEPAAGQVTAHFALGKGGDAEAAAKRAVEARPQSADLQVLLASVRERQGRVREAEAGYEKALQLEPGHLLGGRALASLYERSRRARPAIELLESTARAHPDAVPPLADLAALHVRAGDTKAAIAAYRRALQRAPGDALVLNNLAFLLSADPQRLDEALQHAEAALARVPASPTAADTLGWILYLKGDLPRAERLLAQAVAAAPGSPQMRYHLGKVYAQQGKHAEARAELERALKAGGFPEAKDARATLNGLK